METTLDYDRETGRVIWSRDTFRALGQAGFLDDGRYELLEGEIVRIVPPNEPHTFINSSVINVLIQAFGWRRVRAGGALVANETSEPIPDVAVGRQPGEAYVASGIPSGSEFVLVVEVSDTTIGRDLGQKARLYAQAGVPEYWVIDVNRRCVVVHRLPSPDGYADIRTLFEGDTLALPEMPEDSGRVEVAQLLPPA